MKQTSAIFTLAFLAGTLALHAACSSSGTSGSGGGAVTTTMHGTSGNTTTDTTTTTATTSTTTTTTGTGGSGTGGGGTGGKGTGGSASDAGSDAGGSLCTQTGGTESMISCTCASQGDFPSTCTVGTCTCAPGNSHMIKTCNCASSKCYDPTLGCITKV